MTDGPQASPFVLRHDRLEQQFTFVHSLTLDPQQLTLHLTLSHYSSDAQTQLTVHGVRHFNLDVMDPQEMQDFPLDILRFKIVPDEQYLQLVTTACEVTSKFDRAVFGMQSLLTSSAVRDSPLTINNGQKSDNRN